MKILFLSLLLLLSIDMYAWKAEGSCQLLELYTSEGCSSCPPADHWISSLKKSPSLWTEVVPLSFHVDYWDYIGWTDKFAQKKYSNRQRGYANLWKSATVYTPGIVLHGKESSVQASFQKTKEVLKVEWNGRKMKLRGNFQDTGLKVHFAWLGNDILSNVRRGENAGKNLKHDFVVLDSDSLGDYKEDQEIDFKMPSNLIEKPNALVVWIEKNRIPLVAVGNEL